MSAGKRIVRNTGESFAVQVVRQLCPTWSSIDVARVKEEDEQAILLMLTDGVQILKSVGQVFSTAAFDGMMQPNPPSVKVGLSIDSNLVEISPIADEVPMNEVGALLDSYRRKRRYHRLKNGTFVDLKEADLHELDQVSTDLDLSEKQLDSGIIKIPGYQAFLLDSQVDDEGKSASFVDYVNDVRIIDPKRYEVPERLKAVLRPYQVEGFQWLSTLWDKGFGGILADEMGLGKSVQLLSLIEARKGNGPSLIVCPASLVYNWAAECEKFAGDLTVEVVAGTKAQRRKAIATVAAQSQENDGATTNGTTTYDGTDVVITSYDLLRRDVDDYAACHFALMALDEAQYIKNHATKVAKSVKQVTADHRFALTGTPIENRLSELWSIFDFLMPTCMDEGKKVLVFSQFTSFLELIGARLAEQGVEYYTITGETPKKRRVELVDEFNGNDVPVFLISLKAGNTGLNLVGASVVVHADPWWNAAAQNQATDRAHRIGQTQDVNVYQIVAKDTIEERILKLQEKKNELARQFTDGTASGGVGTLSKDDLLGLLS